MSTEMVFASPPPPSAAEMSLSSYPPVSHSHVWEASLRQFLTSVVKNFIFHHSVLYIHKHLKQKFHKIFTLTKYETDIF